MSKTYPLTTTSATCSEFEHVTLVRVLIAKYTSERAERLIGEALILLERLLTAAEEGGRIRSAIEILVLQALAHEAQNNTPLALAPLTARLVLAEPKGYVRIFVDEGTTMANLLSAVAAHGRMPEYIGRLLAAFEADSQSSDDNQIAPPHPMPNPSSSH